MDNRLGHWIIDNKYLRNAGGGVPYGAHIPSLYLYLFLFLFLSLILYIFLFLYLFLILVGANCLQYCVRITQRSCMLGTGMGGVQNGTDDAENRCGAWLCGFKVRFFFL